MTTALPPSGTGTKKPTELNKINEADPLVMTKPEIKSKFPLADRFINFINCCKPPKDPIGTMLEQKELFTFKEEFPDAHQQKFGLKIRVKETGSMLLDPNVTHPFVKVHIVDMNTCKYLAKSNPLRPGVYNLESVSLIDAKGKV
jgi:hypothetical protein